MPNPFHHLFLPHHSNNHRPKVLHHRPLAVLTLLLILAQFSLRLIELKAPQILGYASNIPPERIVELTNLKRATVGLPPLTLNAKLSDAARRKAADMLNKNYWAHNSPEGTKPWSFVLAAGYNYLHAGENLARDFNNPESIVDAWMNSPSHRDNLLNSRFKEIGVAVVDGNLTGSETTLVVQMFGTPQSATPKISETSNNTLVQPVLAQNTQAETPAPTVEPSPSPIPQPTPTPIQTQTTQVSDTTPTLFDAFQVTRAVSLAFAILLILVLAVDWFVAWQKNLIRISGKNWAHLTFLGFVVLLALIIKQGIIL